MHANLHVMALIAAKAGNVFSTKIYRLGRDVNVGVLVDSREHTVTSTSTNVNLIFAEMMDSA